MTDRVISQVQTPEDIVNGSVKFIIPSYQRPYVWPDDDILKLFDDIVRAQRSEESNYYIGTVLTAQECENTITYELIDGQQRTTTLMLMAIAFHALNQDTPLSRLAVLDGKPRLNFSIRSQVQSLLGHMAGLDVYKHPGEEAIKNNPYLTRLHGALKVLKKRVDQLEPKEQSDIALFIYERVQWVNNVMPDGMDLNRLFATMNTRGIQLEQSDILKSLLLKNIKTEKRRYEAIWLACEHTENYFERNVRQLFKGTDWEHTQPEDLSSYDPSRFKLSDDTTPSATAERNGLTIAELATNLNDLSTPLLRGDEDEDHTLALEDEVTIYCRSIIRFPLLLMHCYRVYRGQQGMPDIEVRLHSDRLIESFKDLVTASEGEVKAFIECLWQIRYQFDRWIMKWIERDDAEHEHLRLTEVYPTRSSGKRYLSRSDKGLSNLVQLQSVRYFTGERSAQYWLTPLLGQLISSGTTKEKDVLRILERIDNQLSLVPADATQKEASFQLLTGERLPQRPIDSLHDYLKLPLGTRFEHYWFQKLEYLLWKQADKNSDVRMQQYRIASRNSVEHVHPQNEQHGQEVDLLHAFGNLVLLNPGQNSSYSNKPVRVKMAEFSSKPVYDSLKLKRIYENFESTDGWSTHAITQHEDEMIDLLCSHYGKS